ncbi:MAG: helix-hairpin-helix domain-containing protein [Saprospiraceae bacterium]|nr:helix-hairpin-helix domain-containing protein [Saprospiraceae bacterium]
MDWKDNFSFTRQERSGIITFLILSFFLVSVFKLFLRNDVANSDYKLTEYLLQADSTDFFENSEENNIENDFSNKSQSYYNKENKKSTRLRFTFDPNLISEDSLLMLGFSKFAAKNLANYRNKGGKIQDSEKFKTIYGMDTVLINDLQDFIVISDIFKHVNRPQYSKDNFSKNEIKVVSLQFVELNSADSVQLTGIKGIGPYKASSIIRYRKRLGGFLDVEQILEVKGISDSLYLEIKDFMEVDENLINRININTADYKTLISHPYMEKNAVNLILNYRKQHGSFQSPKEIKRIRAFKEEFVNKILPYLSVE